MIFLLLVAACAFGAICLICVVIFRMREINTETKEINQRLKFWLSERSISGEQVLYNLPSEDKDESFAKRVLVPLGEQVGHWMAEKVPYHKQSAIRKLLIKAGYRDKKSLNFFYAVKIIMGAAFLGGALFAFSIIGKDMQSGFLLGMISAVVGYILPNFYLDKKAGERQQNIDGVLPDALDLLVICTEAGMGVDLALLRVASNLGVKGKDLSEEIILTNREMNLGQERSLCWSNMGERTKSEELKGLARVISQSEKVGASVGGVLRSQADFLRLRRRQNAEETAAKMTVKMMIPMAFFIFPCIMAVTIGPPVLKLVSTFSGLGK